jgi:hypothetical protein
MSFERTERKMALMNPHPSDTKNTPRGIRLNCSMGMMVSVTLRKAPAMGAVLALSPADSSRNALQA